MIAQWSLTRLSRFSFFFFFFFDKRLMTRYNGQSKQKHDGQQQEQQHNVKGWVRRSVDDQQPCVISLNSVGRKGTQTKYES